jgi:hypothetical protein
MVAASESCCTACTIQVGKWGLPSQRGGPFHHPPEPASVLHCLCRGNACGQGQLSLLLPALSLRLPRGALIQHLLRILTRRFVRNTRLTTIQIAAHLAPRHGAEIRALHRPAMNGHAERLSLYGFALGSEHRLDVPRKPYRKRHRLREYRRPSLAPFGQSRVHPWWPGRTPRGRLFGRRLRWSSPGFCVHHAVNLESVLGFTWRLRPITP